MPLRNGVTDRRKAVRWRHAAAVLLCLAAPVWAAPGPTPDAAVDPAGPARTLHLRGAVFHVQGLEMDAEAFYVTSVNKKTHRGYLHKFTRAGDLVRTVDVTDGPRDHPGGISLDGDSLWVPIAESRADSTARIVQFDKHTLTSISAFPVADHIGAIAVRGAHLIGVNWRTTSFYVWTRDGQPVATPGNPTRVRYQDMKTVGGDLVASGLMPDGKAGAIDWLDPDTFTPRQRLAFGKMANGLVWTREGMAVEGDTLYLMPADGGKDGLEIHVFDLPDMMVAARTCAVGGVNRCLLEKRGLAAR